MCRLHLLGRNRAINCARFFFTLALAFLVDIDRTLQLFTFLQYTPGQCPELPAPENGRVAYTGRLPGDTATIKCNAGYAMIANDTTLVPNNSVICTENRTWALYSTLKCVGK